MEDINIAETYKAIKAVMKLRDALEADNAHHVNIYVEIALNNLRLALDFLANVGTRE